MRFSAEGSAGAALVALLLYHFEQAQALQGQELVPPLVFLHLFRRHF
jgi:hypothetical protein